MRGGAWGLLAILFISGLPLAVLLPIPASSLTARAPIIIDGDAAFTTANGVVGGTGTPRDPYVIEGWEILASGIAGIWIHGTTQHFIIRNGTVHSGASIPGIYLQNVANGRLQDLYVPNNSPGVLVDTCQNVSMQAVSIAGGASADGMVVTNSRNITFSNGTIFNLQRGIGVTLSSDVAIVGTTFTQPFMAIELSGDGVSTWNYTVAGNRFHPQSVALRAFGIRNMTVQDNIVTIAGVGFNVDYSSRVTIERNIVEDGPLEAGIAVRNSADVWVLDNVLNNSVGGLVIQDTLNATVSGNDVRGSGILVRGQTLPQWTTLSFAANTVNGLPFAAYKGCSDVVLDGAAVAQVLIVQCSRVRVSNITLADTLMPIALASVQDVEISDNDISGAMGDAAIRVTDAVDLTIDRNTIRDSVADGAWLLNADRFTVVENTFERAAIHVRLIYATAGRIHHNNFIHSTLWDADTYESYTSQWDNGYPSGGNYWSAYTGADNCSGVGQDVCTGGDGIGDTARSVGTDGIDRYPLRMPFGIAAEPPVPFMIVVPTQPVAGQDVTFEGGASYDPDGTVLAWDWDFGDGRQASGSSVTHLFVRTAVYNVILTVTDNTALANSTTNALLVGGSDVLPMASIGISGPSPTYIGQELFFDGSASVPGYGSIVRYEWTFGDGTNASGVTAVHAYASAGGFAVSLTVTTDYDLSGTSTVTLGVEVIPAIELRPYEHRAGFRVPVPAAWSLTEDQPVGGLTFETVLLGPIHESFATNILIETDRDRTVREDNTYLRQIVDATLSGVPGSRLSEGPTYRTIAGHAGVVFTATDLTSAPSITQRIAIVVSEDHGRYWFMGLTVHADFYFLYNATFERMIDGFQITAQPERSGTAIVGVMAFGAIAAVVAVIVVLALARRRRTGASPMPAALPPTTPRGTSPAGTQLCAACGTPAAFANRFCVACGASLPPREARPPPGSVGPAPPDSGGPPGSS